MLQVFVCPRSDKPGLSLLISTLFFVLEPYTWGIENMKRGIVRVINLFSTLRQKGKEFMLKRKPAAKAQHQKSIFVLGEAYDYDAIVKELGALVQREDMLEAEHKTELRYYKGNRPFVRPSTRNLPTPIDPRGFDSPRQPEIKKYKLKARKVKTYTGSIAVDVNTEGVGPRNFVTFENPEWNKSKKYFVFRHAGGIVVTAPPIRNKPPRIIGVYRYRT